jgi:hypothetical protein
VDAVLTAADVVFLLLVVLFGGTSLVLQGLWGRPDTTPDRRAVTVLAALSPDDPSLPPPPQFSLAEQVELYVALHARKES